MKDTVIKHIDIDGVGIEEKYKVLSPFQQKLYLFNKIDYYINHKVF